MRFKVSHITLVYLALILCLTFSKNFWLKGASLVGLFITGLGSLERITELEADTMKFPCVGEGKEST